MLQHLVTRPGHGLGVGDIDLGGGESFAGEACEEVGAPAADGHGAADGHVLPAARNRRASSRPMPDVAPAMKTVREVMSMARR